MLVQQFLRDTAGRTPHAPALIGDDGNVDFAAIDQASDRLGTGLQARGVRRGDRVLVMLESSAEMVIGFWGCLKAGAVFVPVSPATKEDKLAFLLEDSGAVCLIAPAALASRIGPARAAARDLRAVIWAGAAADDGDSLAAILARDAEGPEDSGLIDQDLCLIIYTSGSTGRPKGVMMTHHAISNNAWSISTYLGNRPDDCVLCALPLSFDYGLFQIITGARVGFAVLLQRSFAFPYEILKAIARHRVTGLPGVPTIFARLLQFAPFEGLDLSSLRYLSNTGAPFPPAHIARWRELLPQARIFSMYGLTECTRVGYLDPARIDEKPGSVGRAMPNSEVWLVDDKGARLPPGAVGELVVRGSSLMRGYWRRPEETAQALREGPVPGEKLLYTGDWFRMDKEGDLYFLGRRDDIFKCRGEKVSPKEIEAVLYELEEVAEAAIIGVPDEIEGMAIKAVLVPRAGHEINLQAVKKHCRARLEPRLVPKFIELRGELPKTESGKITKKLLRTG